jgi:hypothetical protein
MAVYFVAPDINDCYVVPSRDLAIVRQGNENRGADKTLFRKIIVQKLVEAIPLVPVVCFSHLLRKRTERIRL